MIPSILEKLGFIVTVCVLYSHARISALDATAAVPDTLLCALFVAAFIRTRASVGAG